MRFKHSEYETGHRCSFCGKGSDVGRKLVSSAKEYPRVYICNECIAVCNSLLGDEGGAAQPANQVVLAPDVAEVFPDSGSVNDALRQLMGIAQRIRQSGR